MELFNRHQNVIENDPADVLGPLVDDLETEFDGEESEQEHEDLEDEEWTRPDWMILSEMRLDAIPEYSSDLGLRDIDCYD